MKSMIVVALALVAVAAAVPVEDGKSLIIREKYEPQPNGEYEFGFETDNGLLRGEKGKLKEVLDEENKSHTVVVVRGSYTYVNEAGDRETISYEADENGYRAQGPSIPQPPARR